MSVPVSFVPCEDTRTSEQVGSLSHILLLLCFYVDWMGSNPSNLHTKRNKAIDVHETNYVPVI